MTFKPAHKDTTSPAGQIRNEIPRELTIGGIVDRMMRSEAQPIKKKLTFDEWWITQNITTRMADWSESCDVWGEFRDCWKAAQENK